METTSIWRKKRRLGIRRRATLLPIARRWRWVLRKVRILVMRPTRRRGESSPMLGSEISFQSMCTSYEELNEEGDKRTRGRLLVARIWGFCKPKSRYSSSSSSNGDLCCSKEKKAKWWRMEGEKRWPLQGWG